MQVAERSLADWLQSLLALQPDKVELGLERIERVWHRLGAPKPGRLKALVAGTNGKGSCIETMRVLGQNAGLRVGSYTSPHLSRFNERIQIPEGPAEDRLICDAFAQVKAAQQDARLSWFEFTTLGALCLLDAQDLDLALLEIGLGGRLDAVNVVPADISVLTNVALDHCEYLGYSRDEIALEKAAIARKGQRLIYGESSLPSSLMRTAGEQSLDLIRYGIDYQVAEVQTGAGRFWSYRSGMHDFADLPAVPLPLESCAAGLSAFLQLYPDTGYEVVQDAMARLQRKGFPGRNQLMGNGPRVLLDVAHNPHAGAHLVDLVQNYRSSGPDAKVHWVFGASKDKDISGLVDTLAVIPGCWYPVVADVPQRALPLPPLLAELEKKKLELFNQPSGFEGSVAEGLKSALTQAGMEDLVVVCGSLYVVGEALALCQELGLDTDG